MILLKNDGDMRLFPHLPIRQKAMSVRAWMNGFLAQGETLKQKKPRPSGRGVSQEIDDFLGKAFELLNVQNLDGPP